MGHLLALEACLPLETTVLSPQLQHVTTPLEVSAWKAAMETHSDKTYREYIVAGLIRGFRIGFDRRSPLRPTLRNMPSAEEQRAALDAYLAKEKGAGRLVGPLMQQQVNTSKMGVIPKGHTPVKWRVITDLSHPPGASVNDGIDPAFCSLTYVSVDMVAEAVAALGTGALMAKIDIESAYRLIPVHPDDRPLLGIRWRDECFCDGMLPFGLRSAPKIFTAVADALEWCIRQQGVHQVYHYL